MDYGAGHLTVIVGMGTGAFANESCLLGQAFDKCFSNAWGKGGGEMLVAGTDLHIRLLDNYF